MVAPPRPPTTLGSPGSTLEKTPHLYREANSDFYWIIIRSLTPLSFLTLFPCVSKSIIDRLLCRIIHKNQLCWPYTWTHYNSGLCDPSKYLQARQDVQGMLLFQNKISIPVSYSKTVITPIRSSLPSSSLGEILTQATPQYCSGSRCV